MSTRRSELTRAGRPALRRAAATTARRSATSPRRWASRRASLYAHIARSRTCSTRRCATAPTPSTPRSTRSRTTLAGGREDPPRAARPPRASSPSSSTWRRCSCRSGATSRASGASEIVAERRRYEERFRALFREGRELGELRTDLDEARRRCSRSRPPTGPTRGSRAGPRHRRARRPLLRAARRRHARLRDAPLAG